MSDADRVGDDPLPPTLAERVDAACDRFEAAWKAGERPRIEEHLEGAAESERPALLGELLALELAYRRRGGEAPSPEQYRARFADQAGLVDAAFAQRPKSPRPGAVEARPAPADADRHLLFGLLALQVGLIDQAQLVAAFHAWARDKTQPLDYHLTALGYLDGDQRGLVEALAAQHLKKHGSDPERSLAAMLVGRSTRERLVQLNNDETNASLARVGSAPTEPDGEGPTVTYGIGLDAGDGRRFRVLRPHARGGLGEVFVAVDAELNREVALKQILERHADDPQSRQRFVLEAEITGGLEHPGIVPVYGLGTYADGRPYYAMRFVRGSSLKETIDAFHADEGLHRDPGRQSLELSKLLRRFLDVCNAVDYAHSRGVLHRDLKPGNVIVGKHGETLVVDWGLAKATGRSDPSAGERTLRPGSATSSVETLPGSALGTPAYMSPEQAGGELDKLGPATDVYSLGAMLYCLLTGRAPFAGDDVGAVLDRVSSGRLPVAAADRPVDRSGA